MTSDEFLARLLAPPAVEAFKRRAAREGTSVHELLKDVLYKAAVEQMVIEHPEMFPR
jgi:hypothetical protein